MSPSRVTILGMMISPVIWVLPEPHPPGRQRGGGGLAPARASVCTVRATARLAAWRTRGPAAVPIPLARLPGIHATRAEKKAPRVCMWQMPLHGPCRVPGCKAPETSGGQWQFIPEAKCIELELTFRDACTCKRPACRRKVGLAPPAQAPGRKRATPGDAGPATAVALHVDGLPRPPIVASIDEIWAERCAPRSNARPPATVARWLTAAAPSRARRRCLDFEALDEEARGNPLPHARSRALEYAVHGKWRRSESDRNGVYGTWWVGVPQLVATFGKEMVRDKIAAYQGAQVDAFERAVSDAESAVEEEGEGGGEDEE